MPVRHDVLIRFNPQASKATCLRLAEAIPLASDVIARVRDAEALEDSRKIFFSEVLNYICNLKDIINEATIRSRGSSAVLIYSARWSENVSRVSADAALTAEHGVTHKVEMEMADTEAVAAYFNHPKHLDLVAKFAAASEWPDKVFNPDGKPFAIPFDSERPVTPRTEADLFKDGRGTLNPENAKSWAEKFSDEYRGGFSRTGDLATVARVYGDSESPLNQAVASCIRAVISNNVTREGDDLDAEPE